MDMTDADEYGAVRIECRYLIPRLAFAGRYPLQT